MDGLFGALIVSAFAGAFAAALGATIWGGIDLTLGTDTLTKDRLWGLILIGAAVGMLALIVVGTISAVRDTTRG